MDTSEEIMMNSNGQLVEYEITLKIPKIFFCAGKDDDAATKIDSSKENAGKTNLENSDGVLVIVAWENRVYKLYRTNEEMENPIELVLLLRTTETECKRKLQTSPVVIKLRQSSKDVGVAEVSVSKCFYESILCGEFSSQTLEQDLIFNAADDRIAAKGSLTFNMRKLADLSFAVEMEESFASLKIDEAVVANYESKPDTFCENFKITQDLPRSCRKKLDEFHNLNF